MLDNNQNSFVSDYVFNPTINPFKNGIIINYKKVGTRFLSHVLSMPKSEWEDNLQIDLFLKMGYPNVSEDYRTLIPDTLSNYYVKSSFEALGDNPNEFAHKELSKFKQYRNTKEFLEYCDVTNFNDFFYNNPKDLYFLVRNPIERFISGTVQILMILFQTMGTDENTRDEIRYYTKLSDSDIKTLFRFVNADSINDLSKLQSIPSHQISLVLNYLLEKRWDMLLQDIHTENYLVNYKNWINNAQDKTKIKIINLNDLSTDKFKKLICKLRGDDIIYENEEFLSRFIQSNKVLYGPFIEKFILNHTSGVFSPKSVLSHYIKSEMQLYYELTHSPYYVDLKD